MRHPSIEYSYDFGSSVWTAVVRSGERVIAQGRGSTRDECDEEIRSEMRGLIRLSAAIASAGKIC